jgi:hypothetical protein
MAKDDPVADEEPLVRALLPALYDEGKRKANSSAFSDDPEVSVSLTSKLPLEEIAKIFAKQFAAAPPRAVYVVKAQRVREAVAAAIANGTPIEAEIVEDPIKNQQGEVDNPAHALIKPFSKAVEARDGKPAVPRASRAFPRGVSKQILRSGETWDIAVSPPERIVQEGD